MEVTSRLAQGFLPLLVKPLNLPSLLDTFASKIYVGLDLSRFRLLVIIILDLG